MKKYLDKMLMVCYNGGNPSTRGACDAKKTDEARAGFTIIEVMLVLALTGMLLIGLLGGTFASIASQRYADSARSFAEYLRQEYSEVLSPESLGSGQSQSYAIYGKALVFGEDYDNVDDNRKVYSVILIGDAKIPESTDGGFIAELAGVGLTFYCGQPLSSESSLNTDAQNTSVSFYEPLWQSDLTRPEGLGIKNPPFTGTVIIARTPTSGAIHTVYTPQVYNLRDECNVQQGESNTSPAADKFTEDLQSFAQAVADGEEGAIEDDKKFFYQTVGICVTSENANRYREIRIAKDGHNTSAISMLSTDITDDWIEGEDNVAGSEARNQCNE